MTRFVIRLRFLAVGNVCTRPRLAPAIARCLGRISSCALTVFPPVVTDLRFHPVSNTGSLTPALLLTSFDYLPRTVAQDSRKHISRSMFAYFHHHDGP